VLVDEPFVFRNICVSILLCKKFATIFVKVSESVPVKGIENYSADT
jgi:hypothetical protein